MTMTPVLPTPASRPGPTFMPWYMKEGERICEYTVCTAVGEGSGGVVYEVKDAAGGRSTLLSFDQILRNDGTLGAKSWPVLFRRARWAK